MTPYFSIIIPLYNKEKHIKDTLNSVWSQSFTNFEVIVVNDGSTDGSLEEVKTINDERLNIFNIENQGVSHARNYGILKAKANFIAFLDADDIWYEHHLQDLKDLHEQFPGCGMYCKAYEKIKGKTIIDSHYKGIPKNKIWSGVINDYFYHSGTNSLASSSSIAIQKSIFESVGYFNENYNSGEDTDLWIRIALKYPTAFENRVSVTHNLNASHKLTNSLFSGRNHIDLSSYAVNELKNSSLKTYLDLNRYSAAIQYKLENNLPQSNYIYHQIDVNNLTSLQKRIYSLPSFVIKMILVFRNSLRRLHLDLRLFK